MGKRMRKGVRSSPSPSASANIKSIARDIESLGLASSLDADAVTSQLRSHFQRSYLRHKVRTLTFSVDKALRFLRTSTSNTPSSVTTSTSSDSDDVGGTPARKRPNRSDPSEQRLLRAESQHIRSRSRINRDPSESSDSDDSTSTSKSEDADFEAKLDPEFDVTSSLLREKYAKLRAAAPVPAREERNVEIEAAVGKKKRTFGSPEKEAAVKGDVAVGREGPRFRDLGGMKSVIEELMMEVIVPLCHPQLPRWLGVRPMAGILLHGPPGCGKTKLAHAIANETGVPFYKISATEVVSGVSGASEENIRDLFKKAYRSAPSIVFIDEIDAIASKRENLQREMERRIVTQLMTCMDESHQTLRPEDANSESETSDKKPGYVLVIGATNRPDAVDQALRRPGRFDREIALGVPDENGRLEILSVLTKNLRLEGEFDLMKIARSTPGFVGADLAALVNKAGNLAMKRIMDRRKSDISQKLHGEKVEDWWRQPWSPEEIDSLSMIMADFEEAIKMVQPSSRREGFSSIPSTKWEDVGGLKSLRKEFDRYIVQRIKNPEDYEELGVNMEVGFLLYGPPGCGKTLIAKAVANEAGANFIHIKGPELLNKYVGESELAVRTIFSRARTCSPCIVFFDEVDALTTKRGKKEDGL
ncbi:cell division control protein 48-like protein C-like [Iris pallida]|uniref:Cell division control protein 48-like protein C-like n=1 Tax=Iris pallida TaxID=29817 RepID=A0AAX6DXC6_IRIPA|nr:cell division control protein 48-like protein C-like [Iris pallida]